MPCYAGDRKQMEGKNARLIERAAVALTACALSLLSCIPTGTVAGPLQPIVSMLPRDGTTALSPLGLMVEILVPFGPHEDALRDALDGFEWRSPTGEALPFSVIPHLSDHYSHSQGIGAADPKKVQLRLGSAPVGGWQELRLGADVERRAALNPLLHEFADGRTGLRLEVSDPPRSNPMVRSVELCECQSRQSFECAAYLIIGFTEPVALPSGVDVGDVVRLTSIDDRSTFSCAEMADFAPNDVTARAGQGAALDRWTVICSGMPGEFRLRISSDVRSPSGVVVSAFNVPPALGSEPTASVAAAGFDDVFPLDAWGPAGGHCRLRWYP